MFMYVYINCILAKSKIKMLAGARPPSFNIKHQKHITRPPQSFRPNFSSFFTISHDLQTFCNYKQWQTRITPTLIKCFHTSQDHSFSYLYSL